MFNRVLLPGGIASSLMLLIYPMDSMSQTGVDDDDDVLFKIPGGLIPENNTVGPVGNVGAEYKFEILSKKRWMYATDRRV